MTVVGAFDDETARVMAQLYSDLSAPFICKPIEIAEMIKYTCNVWHATKVAFANEIGSIAKAVGVDGREVMDVVCQDHKLNLSRYYMKPGFAFGGSCLPKDVRALSYRAGKLDVKTPLISSIMPSNEYQVRRAFEIIEGLGKRRIGMLDQHIGRVAVVRIDRDADRGRKSTCRIHEEVRGREQIIEREFIPCIRSKHSIRFPRRG